eukprot:COSAG01_NODE_1672_length_9554_cov_4.065785_9_plen_205_part_00
MSTRVPFIKPAAGQPCPLDRPLDRPAGRRSEVNLSAFAYLFSETVQYCRDRSATLAVLERKLERIGHRVGSRTLELSIWRDRPGRRETRLLNMLTFIQTVVWKQLFGAPADDIQKSVENDNEYYLIENLPLINRFISVPDDLGNFNCGSFLAGIVQGCLDGAEFPAEVTAQSVESESGAKPDRTFVLIKFDEVVMERERKLGSQ